MSGRLGAGKMLGTKDDVTIIPCFIYFFARQVRRDAEMQDIGSLIGTKRFICMIDGVCAALDG